MTQSANLMEAKKLKKNAEVQETREDDKEHMDSIYSKYASHVCGTEFLTCSFSYKKEVASSIFEEDEVKLINEDRDECEVSIESFMIDNPSSDYEAGSDDSQIMICVVETKNKSAHTEFNFVNTQFIRVPIIDERLSEKSKILRDTSQERLNSNFNHVAFRKEDKQREGSTELKKNPSKSSSNNTKLLWNKIKIDSERNEFEHSNGTMNGRLKKSLSHQIINSKSSFTDSRKEDQQREKASEIIKKSPPKSSSNNAKAISTDFISDSESNQSKTSTATATSEEGKSNNENINEQLNDSLYKENRCVHIYSGIAHISDNLLQSKSFQIINNSRENIGNKSHSKDTNLNVINHVHLDVNNLGGKSSKFQNIVCIKNQKEIGREAQQINIDSSFFIEKNQSLMSEQLRTFDDRTDYDSAIDTPSLFDGSIFRTFDDRTDYDSVTDTPSLFDGLSSSSYLTEFLESEGLDKAKVLYEPSVQITNYSPNSYSYTNKLERKGENLKQPEEIKMEAKNVTTEVYSFEKNTGDNRCGTSNSEKTKEKSETFSSVINYIDAESYNSMMDLD